MVTVLVAVVGGAGCVFDASGLEPQPTEQRLDGTSSQEDLQQVDGHGPGAEGQLVLREIGVDAPAHDRSVDAPSKDTTPPDKHVPLKDSEPDAASYAWKTGPWSSCSKTCGGGTQTRSVWCERNNGTKVADSYCTGTSPATSQACNTQPCCSTAPCCKNPCCGDPLQNKMVCDGKEKVQWTQWGQNMGNAADQASCMLKCVSWAKSQNYKQWCCRLYEDSSPGTNWVCRVYQSGSMSTLNSSINYSGLGHCP
jgi:hypothetical protein